MNEPGAFGVTEANVQALFDEWLRAQNAGDYTAYEKLYAQKFMGKKLAGRRSTEFGRQGWLLDRAAMFKKPFTVTVTGLKVALSPDGAMLQFEQTWSNESYRDRGAKFMTVVLEGHELRIAREEMLSSKDGKRVAASPPKFEDLAIARSTLSHYALLVPGPVDINWAVAHPRYISDWEAMRPVSLKAVPSAHRQLLDGSYEVFDEEGRRCEAQPKALVILLHVVPHFGIVNLWTDFPERKNPVPLEQRALDLWEMSMIRSELASGPKGMSLALEFEKQGNCSAPHWGRQVGEGKEPPWKAHQATGEEAARIDAAARSHPEALERAKSWSGTEWITGTQAPRVFEGPRGQAYVTTTALGRSEGCGLDGTAVLVWRRSGGSLVPVAGTFGEPIQAVVDADGDGEPEFVGGQSVYGRSPTGYEQVIEPLELYLDCPC